MRIAVSNPDNIGDLVLRQPMIAALLEAGHEVMLIVRDFVAPLAADMFPRARILQCVGNPYDRNFGLQSPLGLVFVEQAVAFNPNLFVVAAYQHTRLEELLAAAMPEADAIGFSGHLFQARDEGTAVSTIQFTTRVTVVPDSSELDKNATLCAAVLGRDVRLGPPRMEATPQGMAAAQVRLGKLGLAGQRFWAVCAGDIPGKSVKNWQREQWAEFCRALMGKHAVHLLFIGSTDEHDATLAIQKMMGEDGLRTAAITDEPTKLQALTAMLQLAEGYIGKDTGPMHIAAALGKPVLAVFGGGHWPRFVPAARTGAAFTVSVPCTGCNWVCHLSRSHCVKDIPVATVLRSADAMLRGEVGKFTVEVLQPDRVLGAAIMRELWESTQVEHRKVAAERANFMQWHDDRMRDIVQLRDQLEAVKGELEFNSAAATETETLRREAQGLERRLAEAETALEARQRRVEELLAVGDRARALEERTATLEFESRLAMSTLRQATDGRAEAERRLERFRHVAVRKITASRLKAERLKSELETLRPAMAGLEKTAGEVDFLRQRLEEKTILAATLQIQVDTADSRYQGQIADREQLLKRKSVELESALALIPDLREELAALSADVAVLEETNRDRAAKQDLIDTLQRQIEVNEADRERRLEVIEKLSVRLAESERDRDARLRLIESISERLAETERDREARLRLIESLSERLTESERDREARLRLIERLSEKLAAIEADRANRGEQIVTLHELVAALQAEINAVRNLLPYRILRQLRIV
ncbi:MAG: glycosyltransferase family 9 protein [Bryobacteraceae bacterium]